MDTEQDGAAPETEPSATPSESETPGATPDPDPNGTLGEAGLKALRDARDEVRALKAALGEAKERDAAREREALSEQERAIADARRDAASEERAKWQRRVVETEARAALVGRVRIDPGKALRLLDIDALMSADNDDIDADAVRAAVDALLESEPQLAADTPPPAAPKPSKAGIGTGGTPAPTLATMSLDDIGALGMPRVT